MAITQTQKHIKSTTLVPTAAQLILHAANASSPPPIEPIQTRPSLALGPTVLKDCLQCTLQSPIGVLAVMTTSHRAAHALSPPKSNLDIVPPTLFL